MEKIEMGRRECLKKAADCVTGQRVEDYGTPENNFRTIARMWTAYLHENVIISQVDVAMMMAMLKIARISSGGANMDSFVDLAGYAACAAEIESLQRVEWNKEDAPGGK